MRERWKAVTCAGEPIRGYDISNLGQVRSYWVRFAGGRSGGLRLAGTPQRILAQRVDKYGYMIVELMVGQRSTSGRQRKRPFRVHRLVLEAFRGPCPPGLQCLHGPAGRLDNTISNLSYGTGDQNCRDKIRDGTAQVGRRNHKTRLTEEQVQAIRRDLKAGLPKRAVARQHGIGQRHVKQIERKEVWGWLPEED